MAIDFPQEISSLEERLALLDDPEFAEALARNHPLHYPGVALAAPPLAGRPRRYGSIALAITAAASLVGSALLVPIFAHRTATQPVVSTSVRTQGRPKPQVRVAPVTPANAAKHAALTPAHAAAAAPVALAPAIAAPAHTVAVAPARSAPIAHAVAATAVAPRAAIASEVIPASASHQVARPASSSDYAPATANASASARASAEASGAGFAEPGAVTPRVSLADANETLSPSGGTKTPPGGGAGYGPEHNPVAAVLDPCSPQSGRFGAIANQLRSSGQSF